MSDTRKIAYNLVRAIEDERYDRAEDSFSNLFADKAAPRLEQEKVRVAQEFLGKSF